MCAWGEQMYLLIRFSYGSQVLCLQKKQRILGHWQPRAGCPNCERGQYMLKNKYKDDYSRFERLNGKGRVVEDICYTGDYYLLPFEKQQKRKTNLANLGFTGLLWAVQIGAGMVNQDSSRTFWIVYPYLFLYLPLAYLFLGAATYLEVSLRMQRVQYETGVTRIRRSLKGAMALSGVCLVLGLVYLALHFGEIQVGRELIYLLCHCLFLAVAFLYARYYNRTYSGIAVEKGKPVE